jgi:UDP-N-acetylmuramoyl-L-alanyl-D-glutamate--2,6-diaminopimelate ligase
VPLGALASLVGAEPAAEQAGVLVTGVTLDSRDVVPGDLFAAVPGEHLHRAEFVPAAVASGAVAVLTDPDGATRASAAGVPVLVTANPRQRLGEIAATVYGRPAEHLRTIGVTGTNGKTTTTYLLASGLTRAGLTPGLVGTVETRLGHRTLPSVRTTPEATDLQALLAAMVEDGAQSVALEVSSHALVLGRVDGIRFDVAVFTNLGSDHLDFHRDVEDYFAAKASLFEPSRCRTAVINIDDPYGRRLAASVTVPVITYSAEGDAGANWRAADVAAGPDGSAFEAVGPDGSRTRLRIGIPGAYNVSNALGALAALGAAGVPVDAAAEGISACPGVPGRMERVDAGQDFTTVVDYAHTPDAVAAALATLRPVTQGRLLLVVGCGGDRDRGKRPVMGEVAARGSDLLVVTDDNPRSEDPAKIRAAILEGALAVPEPERATVTEVEGREAAIAYAVGQAEPGDLLLVAGRGHETGQEVRGEFRPLDDRVVLRSALQARAVRPRRPAR